MLGTTVIITLEIFLSYFLLFTVHHPPRSVNAPLSRRTNGDCFPRGRRASHRHHLEPAELFLVALVFPSLGLELPIQVTARNLSICGQLQHRIFSFILLLTGYGFFVAGCSTLLLHSRSLLIPYVFPLRCFAGTLQGPRYFVCRAVT